MFPLNRGLKEMGHRTSYINGERMEHHRSRVPVEPKGRPGSNDLRIRKEYKTVDTRGNPQVSIGSP